VTVETVHVLKHSANRSRIARGKAERFADVIELLRRGVHRQRTSKLGREA
jgi:hypothetical protein